MPPDPDADDEAAGAEVAAVEVAAVEVEAGADEAVALEEVDEPEPQPPTARQTRTSAQLARRRIDPVIAVLILMLLFCCVDDRPIGRFGGERSSRRLGRLHQITGRWSARILPAARRPTSCYLVESTEPTA
jgi:hypothetical protein